MHTTKHARSITKMNVAFPMDSFLAQKELT